jgi:uncharacterized protein (TIGR02145 family)
MKKNSWFFLLMLAVLIGLSYCVKEEPPALETNNKNKEESNAKDSTGLPVEVINTIVTIETARDASATFEIINDLGVLITYVGVCWSTSQNPTINDSKWDGYYLSSDNKWHVSIEGLEKSTTYYLRAFATSSAGTAYGNEVSFTTPASSPPIAFNPNLTYGSVTDVDGNTYKTIQIGTQTWITENLKTTRYSDGSPILFGTGGPAGFTDWFDCGDGNYLYNNGAYCWYDNDASTYKDAFGAIYNWHAVGTGKLCPTGWHVPTISDWTTLIKILGGTVEPFNEPTENAWIHCSDNSINESGFTPVKQGELCGWGFLKSDFWWSATPRPTDRAVPFAYLMSFYIYGFEPQSYGYSVRCLKD